MLLSILGISFLILIHEAGHFLAARAAGVNVPEFSLGFGRILASKEYRGSLFCLRMIPIGGYIKADALHDRSPLTRILVGLAGPAANFLFAALAFMLISGVGIPHLTNKIGQVVPGYPAKAAGLLPGDRVVAVDDQLVEAWPDMTALVDRGQSRNVKLTIQRGANRFNVNVRPEIKDGRGVIGVIAGETAYTRYGLQSIPKGLALTTDTVRTSAGAFFRALWLHNNRVMGPVGIVKAGAAQATLGWVALLYFLAILSANLVTFNLLPIPALDGGSILLALWEIVSKRPVPGRVQRVLTAVSVGLIIALLLHSVLNDVVKLSR